MLKADFGKSERQRHSSCEAEPRFCELPIIQEQVQHDEGDVGSFFYHPELVTCHPEFISGSIPLPNNKKGLNY